MAQWESARLEAEARLVRQSKLRSNSFHNPLVSPEFSTLSSPLNKPAMVPPGPPRCLDVLKAWNGVWTKPNDDQAGTSAGGAAASVTGLAGDLESPTSTLSYSENAPQMSSNGIGDSCTAYIEFVGNSSGSCEGEMMKEEGEEDWKGIDNSMSLTSGLQDMAMTVDNTHSSAWTGESLRPDPDSHQHVSGGGNFVERFTDLLLSSSGCSDRSFCEGCGESDNGDDSGGAGLGAASHDYLEDNKNYWNSILNLVDSSPSDSPMF